MNLEEPWVQFEHHCEDECGLGQIAYLCPHCNKVGYELGKAWFEYMEYDLKDLLFDCENCEKPIVVSWVEGKGYELRRN